MGYYEQLQDPKWTKKRKKIIQRDHYACTVCGSHNNLQVHHTYYLVSEPPPWAYPDKSLLTVCDMCHKEYHETHELTILDSHPTWAQKPKKEKKFYQKRISKKQRILNRKERIKNDGRKERIKNAPVIGIDENGRPIRYLE